MAGIPAHQKKASSVFVVHHGEVLVSLLDLPKEREGVSVQLYSYPVIGWSVRALCLLDMMISKPATLGRIVYEWQKRMSRWMPRRY